MSPQAEGADLERPSLRRHDEFRARVATHLGITEEEVGQMTLQDLTDLRGDLEDLEELSRQIAQLYTGKCGGD